MGWHAHPTFSLPLPPPQDCTYSIPSSDPQVSSTATSSSALLSHRPALGIRTNHPASQTGFGGFFTYILFFFFHLYSKTFFSNVSFDRSNFSGAVNLSFFFFF